MEPVAIRSERRGRKRRRNDEQNGTDDRQVKKQVVGTRSKALVGRYVMKEFKGSGTFLGKVVSYDTGLYRVDYEDGDCEDLESAEVRRILIGDGDLDDDLILRKKKKLDELLAKKDAKEKDVTEGNANDSVNAMDRVEASSPCEGVTASSLSGDNEIDDDADSSGDSCEHAREQDIISEVVAPVVPPPQLPPSSGSIGVPEEYVSHLFSVYGFLRSFSIRLFLSPFELDEFVGSLNCPVPNTLLDSIHLALMRALRRHLQMLSSDGSEVASKCLRFTDWNLLDTLTWPVFLIQYFMVMGYANGPKWKGFYLDVLEKDYYTLSGPRKLMILQILCDDVLESEELRAEIDAREEVEVGIDPDAVAAVGPESGPRRVHPKNSKTSACRNEEAVEIIAETHGTKFSCNPGNMGVKGTEMNVDADIVHDGNVDDCQLCGMDGTLLCCDGCPSAYHSRCIGVSKMFIPEGAWYCPECTIRKIGPTITMGTSLRGAEFFGIDPYGQVFLGTCNHLLVLRVSIKPEPCLRYYNLNDIPKLLQALHSRVQHIVVYSEICKGIIQYWDIQNAIFPQSETAEMFERSATVKNDGESTPSFALLGKESRKILVPAEGENLASCMTENRVGNVVVSSLENSCKMPIFNKSSLDTMSRTDHSSQQTSSSTPAKQVCLLKNTELSEQSKVDCTLRSGSVIQQADSSDLTHQSLYGKPSFTESATCTSGNSNGGCGRHVNGINFTANNTSSRSKEGNGRVSGRGYRNSFDYSYMGSHFKPQAYVNNYTHGDFAASAAANLAILSSEETRVSGSQALDRRRKVVSGNTLLQVKAFSSAAIRFFWPNSEKKLVEVPRERCGWCLSCKASVTCKKGCLLNAAVSNAIKGATKILAGIRHVKNGEGSLPGIAMYIMFMEESLCGLTVGLFRSATYRKQWRKQVEQATTCSEIKALLLELEENIRAVAVCGDWLKLVDNWSVESSVIKSATFATGSTQKRGPGRRGRKRSAVSEVTSDDCLDNSSDVNWWRGGMLSKLMLQKGVLPRSLVKKAARQGGYRKIPGAYYAEGSEIPKRSRRYIWRAAVEMCKNASQLALQVRYLDLHVRWSDLVCPEQSLQDGKGPEIEVSAFRNASLCDKKNVGDKIVYGVAFDSQKHLPSRVMKNLIELDQSQDGREKHWFSEMHIPLYLIKEYEEKLDKMNVPLADKPLNAVYMLQRRQLKASRKDIFSYLSCKRENLGKCCCSSCQLDVLFGNAVNCSSCQGFCHEQCTISSTVRRNGEVELLITCKQCQHTKALSQSENTSESPTSPLLLQGQESQNAVPVSKGAKQKSFTHRVTSVRHLESSLEMKTATHDSSVGPKDQRKLCSWGLIWKKNKGEDGSDFRLENLILRHNSDTSWAGPVCHLCNKPYNSDLVYIRCETCKNWYHAEAVELDESRIDELVGFKCCRCRRIRTPLCPYMDPESKKKFEAKRPRIRAPKARNSGVEPDYENNSKQPSELDSNPIMLPKTEGVVHVQKVNPIRLSLSKAEQFTEHKSETDLEQSTVTAPASGTGPLKLRVRRHIKNEDGTAAACNLSQFELSNPSILPKAEEVVHAQKDDPRPFSLSKVEQFTENSEMGLEWEAVSATCSGTAPQKLPVRRHIKKENNVDGTTANNLSQVELSTRVVQNNLMNPNEESFSPHVEWHVSKNGFEDDMLIDYGVINYDDVEFEPQTYFSFTELLASDDGGQLAEVDASDHIMCEWENSPEVSRDGHLEQCGKGTDNHQEPTIPGEPGGDPVPCQRCSRKNPCPDLSCEICGLWIHRECSPWVEQLPWEGNWRCGHCREWR